MKLTSTLSGVEPSTGSHIRLLLVEDNVVDQMAFLRYVERTGLGYQTQVATTIAESRRMLASGQFDIVVLDHNLADGFSFELLDAVGETPVIFVTGAESPEHAVQAMKLGARDYLIKDHERSYLQLLATAVERALKQAQAEQEQIRLQAMLVQSREHLDSIINSVDGIVWEADAQTFQFTFVSRRAERLLGFPVSCWVNEPGFWADHLHPEDREAAVDYCVKHTREKRDYEVEYRMLARDGRVVWLRDIVTVVVHNDQPTRLRGIMVDITDRKTAEQKFRSLLESAPDAMVIVNREGQIVLVNSQTEKMFGHRRETLLGKPVGILIPERFRGGHPLHRDHIFHPPQARPMSTAMELSGLRQDGREFPIEISFSPLETPEGLLISGSIRDITERRGLEEQLRQSQKLEAIGQLAGGVAHDFNNIIAVIMMQTELLASLEDASPEISKGLAVVQSSTERAAGLTRQLLLFSRRQSLQPQELDLNSVVTTLAGMLQRIIGENMQMRLNLHSTTLILRADMGMLDQVLLNFAVNARDAMPEGGRLTIATSEKIVDADFARRHPDAAPGRYVCLSVSDTGCGIPADVLPRIFEPFFTTKEQGKGTGLGLATVFGIVKQHRGWLDVKSTVGVGSTFRIFLPASATTATEMIRRGAAAKPRGGTETILLAEDESSLRQLTRSILERNGYHVLEAPTGDDALDVWRLQGQGIALLLTDLIMPGNVSGKELARRLQAERPGLRVLFASGYSPDLAAKDLLLEEGQNFIQKPYSVEGLLNTVRHCLDAAR